MSVAFVFPHPAEGPTGGYKVVYEYANRLAADGVEVHIVYSGSIFWRSKSLWHKMTNVVRQLQWRVKGYGARRWFPLDGRVREHLSLSMCRRHVPRADVYVATSPYTAWYVARYSDVPSARLFYLIQGREDWGPGLRAILEETYHSRLRKIAVSRWLQRMLRDEYGEQSELVTNGFDFSRFRLETSVGERAAATVSMLWHTQPLKDCATGVKAMEMVKTMYPGLRVTMFGLPERPAALPEWVEYHCRPDEATHRRINNSSAIFLATSLSEGWGLTVGEAMACGQAVVCTDIDGYREMAEDGRNALIVPPGDAAAMARAVSRLIDDGNLRRKLATQGVADISRFTWDASYARLRGLLTTSY